MNIPTGVGEVYLAIPFVILKSSIHPVNGFSPFILAPRHTPEKFI